MDTPPAERPFDAVDLGLMLATAMIPPHWPWAVLLGVTTIARRSPTVCRYLLDQAGWNATDPLARTLLPGAAPQLTAEATPATGQASVLSLRQWRAALDESPHLLIYGPSKAGKSTLAQAYVGLLGGCQYVVIDPQPNKPGERKWGGIDFITLDEHGDDEYASIKQALDRIASEDDRRRRAMRNQTFPPLVIIIDEVLALVDTLGSVINAEGKREPRMSSFIRTMGYSARHRNIKIILIGQGKNLADLNLKSGTARNNYALLRVARNAATNERAAYLVADDGEQAIDVRHVPTLAAQATTRAQVWLTHRAVSSAEDDALLSSLLAEYGGSSAGNSVTTEGNGGSTRVPASERDVPVHETVSVTPAEAAKIAHLLTELEPSQVAKRLDGYHPRKYAEYKAKVDAVRDLLGEMGMGEHPRAK